MTPRLLAATASAVFAVAFATSALAKDDDRKKDDDDRSSSSTQCKNLPGYQALQAALKANVAAAGGETNGGLDFHMWATIVDRDGFVCTVTFSGPKRDSQWPGSRVISAQKAHAANAFSLDNLALSTANLYASAQPGGTLYALEVSNPVDPEAAYDGSPQKYGTPDDPMVGEKIGGVNVFGGGLALYKDGKVIGGLGVSGDTSCADHNVAWRVRRALGLDGNGGPPGVGRNGDDGIIYDLGPDQTPGGFGHPVCSPAATAIAESIGAGYRP